MLIVLAYWLGQHDGQRRTFSRFEQHFDNGMDFRYAMERERRRLGVDRR